MASLAEQLAAHKQQAPKSLAQQLAEHKALAQQIPEEPEEPAAPDPAYEEWKAKEDAKHPALRKTGELLRGGARNIERYAMGARDLIGDGLEALDLPRGPEIPGQGRLFADKNDVSSAHPYSSGSKTEQAGEMLSDFALPGVGGGKTFLSAALRSGADAFGYGLLSSDKDGLGRVFDATQAGTTGSLIGGSLHGVTKGFAKPDPDLDRVQGRLDHVLGDTRISGDLPIAQTIGRSDDKASKVIAALGARGNKGVKKLDAKARSQRFNDDVYRARFHEVFADNPKAIEAAEKVLSTTRDVRKAYKAAKKVAGGKKNLTHHPEVVEIENRVAKAMNRHKTESADRSNSKQMAITRMKHSLENKDDLWIEAQQEAGKLPKSGAALNAKKRALREKRMETLAKSERSRSGTARFDEAARKSMARQGRKEIAEKKEALMNDRINPQLREEREAFAAGLPKKKKKKTSSGRYDASTARAVGDEETAKMLDLVKPSQYNRNYEDPTKPSFKKPSRGKMLTKALAGTLMLPTGVGTAPGGAMLHSAWQDKSKRKAHKLYSKFKNSENRSFTEVVDQLPELQTPMVQNFIAGNTGIQKLIAEGKYDLVLDQLFRGGVINLTDQGEEE